MDLTRFVLYAFGLLLALGVSVWVVEAFVAQVDSTTETIKYASQGGRS